MKKEHILQDFIFVYIGLIYTSSNMLNTPPWVNKVSLRYLLTIFHFYEIKKTENICPFKVRKLAYKISELQA